MEEKDKENIILENARDEKNFLREVELEEKRRKADEARLSKELEHQSKINALEYARHFGHDGEIKNYINNARAIYEFLK